MPPNLNSLRKISHIENPKRVLLGFRELLNDRSYLLYSEFSILWVVLTELLDANFLGLQTILGLDLLGDGPLHKLRSLRNEFGWLGFLNNLCLNLGLFWHVILNLFMVRID